MEPSSSARAGDNVTIGARSFILESDLKDGAVVLDHTVLIGGQNMVTVEWDPAGKIVTPTPVPVTPPASTAVPVVAPAPSRLPTLPSDGSVRRLGVP